MARANHYTLVGEHTLKTVGLGTGQGIAEGFMGLAKEIVGVDSKGNEKTNEVRKQTKHNAFYYMDEGEDLNEKIMQKGSILGPCLRQAWNGEAIFLKRTRGMADDDVPTPPAELTPGRVPVVRAGLRTRETV